MTYGPCSFFRHKGNFCKKFYFFSRKIFLSYKSGICSTVFEELRRVVAVVGVSNSLLS